MFLEIERLAASLQNVFDDLKQQLSLHSLADSQMLQSEEHMETAVLMLGEHSYIPYQHG